MTVTKFIKKNAIYKKWNSELPYQSEAAQAFLSSEPFMNTTMITDQEYSRL